MIEKDKKEIVVKYLENFLNENLGNRITRTLGIGLLNEIVTLFQQQQQEKDKKK